MKDFKVSKYNFDPYANGLLKAIEQTILVCQNRVDKLKSETFEYNTPRGWQVSGELRAYNAVKVNLINKRNKILKAKSINL